MLPEYVDIIKDWPTPRSAAETRSFLGKCSYYRAYIQNFAVLSAPLDENRMEHKFLWGAEQDKAFQNVKQAFLQAFERGPLGVPNFDPNAPPFVLDTDWSCTGISYLLSQADSQGNEVLLACGGRKL